MFLYKKQAKKTDMIRSKTRLIKKLSVKTFDLECSVTHKKEVTDLIHQLLITLALF